MQKSKNLQDTFLNYARTERIPITVYLISGFQFKGVVKGFDSYVILLESEGKQNLVYKHAISTIIPARTINMAEADKAAE